MNQNREHESDRLSPKSAWHPNNDADKIVYLALLILAFALPLIFG